MPKVVNLEELLTATAAGKQRPRPRADVVRGAGGRDRTVGLTVHVPPEVRDQLKVLAIPQGALETVERRGRVVDGRLKVGDGGPAAGRRCEARAGSRIGSPPPRIQAGAGCRRST